MVTNYEYNIQRKLLIVFVKESLTSPQPTSYRLRDYPQPSFIKEKEHIKQKREMGIFSKEEGDARVDRVEFFQGSLNY